jgi:hypothetical protein
MENLETPKNDKEPRKGGLGSFVTKRIILVIVLAVGILWMLGLLLGSFEKTSPKLATGPDVQATDHSQTATKAGTEHTPAQAPESVSKRSAAHPPQPGSHATAPTHAPQSASSPAETHQAGPAVKKAAGKVPATPEIHPAAPTVVTQAPADAHDVPAPKAPEFPATGMAFVDAVIRPLDYELNHRFWGWRPNDILDFTDNVNNFQLGVLEVTRRTAVVLAERISRTGTTAAFDRNLENAMNWYMIKAKSYWFPSPESKYSDGLKEMREYFNRLEKGEATFYNRSDNLIPLLVVYEDLLGSCDENLVKFTEEDGSPVSYFSADDYFFYAKGVASAMVTILEAVMVDFSAVIDSRRGTEVLHHAIISLQHAVEIDPILITNSDLSGILANHRANMAAPISHARFYLGVLIKALST